jgi:ligand-binding sensor domain-containing protein
VAYPRRDKGDTKLVKHQRSAVSQGVAVPQLQIPLIAADITGRCWLAEGTEGGASIHAFDGQAFTDVTPPAELLNGSQLRQLVCDNARGELLVTTSAAGVLVFDGAQWSEHPLNSVLPTVEDTEMKPVDRIAVADDGSLWVATASYLLHWTRDDEQE